MVFGKSMITNKKALEVFEQMKTSLYNAVYEQITKTVYAELNEKIEQIVETQNNINRMQEELNQKINMV